MRIYSGGPLEVPEVSIPETLFHAAKNHPDRVGFRVKRGDKFEDMTWKQVAMTVTDIANGLMSLGVEKGDKVAILSDTRGEWTLADFGILSTGGVCVTVYPTLTHEQIAYLLNDSGAKAVIVENQTQFDKLKKAQKDIKTVAHYVTIDDVADQGGLDKQTKSWTELAEAGRAWAESHASALEDRLSGIQADDVATLVYTSGTTGVPKGAILTHRNFMSASRQGQKTLNLSGNPSSVAFLPLAHCYGRLVTILVTDMAGCIAFSSPKTLGDDLRAVHPTLVASVPRLYERMFDQIQQGVAEQPESKQKIFARAEAVAKEMGKAKSNGGQPGFGLRLRWRIFDKLVYSKLREKLGMTQLEIGFTGAAAIRPDLLYFFQGIGVNLLEGYGLTETSAPSNVNKPTKFKPGTVGPPLPGMEQTLAEDGEVLMKGPNVFQGYYNLPDETKESFTEDGWFRTGDIGSFDEDGYLRIVDRKKELEVLDTGKKIAPITVEEKLKTVSKFVSEACLIATGKKFAGALVQPNYDALVAWAKKNGVAFDESRVIVKPDPTGQPMTYGVGEDLLSDPKVQKLYEEEVAKTNEMVADFERIRVFRLVPHAWTMDRDELTPTLKKKRRVITKNYEKLVEDMFSASKPA